jgi:hypothetical protein
VTFERHGIDHLSASSLNLWMANPREWAVRYLGKEAEDAAEPAVWRGTAVEAGLACRFYGGSIEQARAAAFDNFELNALGDLSDEVEAERSLGHGHARPGSRSACSWAKCETRTMPWPACPTTRTISEPPRSQPTTFH